jgi:hypothetical protein
MSCGIRLAWSDRTCDGGSHCYHKGTCVGCGAPATRECSFSGQFVCGAELCDSCKHYDSSRELGQHRPATPENDEAESLAFERFLARIRRQ